MTEEPCVLSLRGLAHHVGRFDLGPIDLALPEGSITALIGPNGAGKTTLIDLTYGLGHAGTGSITIAGFSVSGDLVAMRQRVAYVSPELAFAGFGRVGAPNDNPPIRSRRDNPNNSSRRAHSAARPDRGIVVWRAHPAVADHGAGARYRCAAPRRADHRARRRRATSPVC